MYILLESDSWYRHYLTEAEEGELTASPVASTAEDEQGDSENPDMETLSSDNPGTNPQAKPQEESKPASDTETRSALESMSAAEFAEKYKLMRANERGGSDPKPELVAGGFLDILRNLGAVVQNKIMQTAPKTDKDKYGAAAGFRLNSNGIRKFKEAWIDAHYKNFPVPLRTAIYNQVDENFTPEKSLLA